jgi:hypothetical protein
VYSRASAAGSNPNSRSVALVIGLMLTSFVRRKSSPNIAANERAIAELVTVVQSMRPDLNAARISGLGVATSVLR